MRGKERRETARPRSSPGQAGVCVAAAPRGFHKRQPRVPGHGLGILLPGPGGGRTPGSRSCQSWVGREGGPAGGRTARARSWAAGGGTNGARSRPLFANGPRFGAKGSTLPSAAPPSPGLERRARRPAPRSPSAWICRPARRPHGGKLASETIIIALRSMELLEDAA